MSQKPLTSTQRLELARSTLLFEASLLGSLARAQTGISNDGMVLLVQESTERMVGRCMEYFEAVIEDASFISEGKQ